MLIPTFYYYEFVTNLISIPLFYGELITNLLIPLPLEVVNLLHVILFPLVSLYNNYELIGHSLFIVTPGLEKRTECILYVHQDQVPHV
jgi:hypothetical protein